MSENKLDIYEATSLADYLQGFEESGQAKHVTVKEFKDVAQQVFDNSIPNAFRHGGVVRYLEDFDKNELMYLLELLDEVLEEFRYQTVQELYNWANSRWQDLAVLEAR